VVENAAIELVVDGVKVRKEFAILAVGLLRTTSMVNGFADAMMWLLVASLVAGVSAGYKSRY